MWRYKLVPYVYKKRNIYYFSRRVPKDLEGHYKASKIVFSLKTKSLKDAKAKSTSLASQLNEEWSTLRWRQNDFPEAGNPISKIYFFKIVKYPNT